MKVINERFFKILVIKMVFILDGLAKIILTFPRTVKRGLVLVLDAGLCILSVWLAYYLRLGYFVQLIGPAFWLSFISVCLALPLFVVSGLYRAIFRYNGLPAILAVIRAIFLYSVIFFLSVVFTKIDGIPLTVLLIQPILLLLLVGASRALARIWLGGFYAQQLKKASLPKVLIYGAGSAGRQLANAMKNNLEICIVGFLDDDTRLHGNILNGLPIYNPIDLNEIMTDLPVSQVLLAMPSISRHRRNEIINQLKPHKLAVRTLPAMSDIFSGKVSLNDIHELDIDDLLGRESVQPNPSLLNYNNSGKVVLVTGAGGSIGSELCRQILKIKPSKILLVEISEYGLYKINQELSALSIGKHAEVNPLKSESLIDITVTKNSFASEFDPPEIIPLLASVCDESRMNEIMSTWKPDTVYHAAAYKHVPLVEQNPSEGLRNNVWGTFVCAEVAKRNGVKNFVLVSTDKAVRPTNIMGASKRIAEMILQAITEHGDGFEYQKTTIFSIVRFGNVLGSSGSVVPLFREQIKRGGPITITHRDITRYFMTIPEAAQLVIQAGAMGNGGDVFVLDMGSPVRIIDLARRIVELSGLTVRDDLHPDGDIEFILTGLRPGEKLYEELLIGENPQPTIHPRIMKAQEQFLEWPKLNQELDKLKSAMSNNNHLLIKVLLKGIVAGYQPNINVVDLIYVHTKKELSNK